MSDQAKRSQKPSSSGTEQSNPEWAALTALEDKFLSFKKPVSCSGSISLSDDALSGLALWYNVSGSDAAFASVDLPMSPEDARALYDAGSPSSFGRGQGEAGANVYDESYRLAREHGRGSFALTLDPVLAGSVLPRIQQALDLPKDRPIRAVPYKLNMYAEGGMSRAHRDTPKGPNHLGTLNLSLPTGGFEGGQLVVRHHGQQTTSDWGSHEGIGWTFLYPDCEHEVLSVTRGLRVTLAYDVFYETKGGDKFTDDTTLQLTRVLKATLDDPAFFPDGGQLGFGLQHEYPADARGHDLAGKLRGIDASWLAAIRECGLAWSLVAVYDDMDDEFYFSDNENDDPESDNWSLRWMRYHRHKRAAYKGRAFLNHTDFDAFEGAVIGEDTYDTYGLLDDPANKSFMKGHVAWVTVSGAWGAENSYQTYGNEWQLASVYVSVGIAVTVPSAVERCCVTGVEKGDAQGGAEAAKAEAKGLGDGMEEDKTDKSEGSTTAEESSGKRKRD